MKADKRLQDDVIIARVKNVEQEGIPGVLTAECRTRVLTDGVVEQGNDATLTVKDATSATLYIVAATNYVNYQNVSHNPALDNEAALASLEGKKYNQLLKNHIEKYQEQYNRVTLNLPKSANSSIETDKRLEAFAEGTDMDMVSLMMQYGRYLLISSSQPGGQPANLQGVWNDKMDRDTGASLFYD